MFVLRPYIIHVYIYPRTGLQGLRAPSNYPWPEHHVWCHIGPHIMRLVVDMFLGGSPERRWALEGII